MFYCYMFTVILLSDTKYKIYYCTLCRFLSNPVISLVLQYVVFCSDFVLLRPSLAMGDIFNVVTKISPSETEHCRIKKISPSPWKITDYYFTFIHTYKNIIQQVVLFCFLFDCTTLAVEWCTQLYCRCRRHCCGSVNE